MSTVFSYRLASIQKKKIPFGWCTIFPCFNDHVILCCAQLMRCLFSAGRSNPIFDLYTMPFMSFFRCWFGCCGAGATVDCFLVLTMIAVRWSFAEGSFVAIPLYLPCEARRESQNCQPLAHLAVGWPWYFCSRIGFVSGALRWSWSLILGGNWWWRWHLRLLDECSFLRCSSMSPWSPC